MAAERRKAKVAAGKADMRSRSAPAVLAHELRGQRVAFFGEFAYWPEYHGAEPWELARRAGAVLADRVDAELDVLVLGELRGTGKADAKKKAERLIQKAEQAGETPRPRVVSEAEYRELFALDVTGKSFCFAGGFDCCPADFDAGLLSRMVEAAGGRVVDTIDADLAYLVLGNRRGKGKTAAQRQAKELSAAGAPLKLIFEDGFLELVRREHTDGARPLEFASLVGQLYSVVDERKLMRALNMLKTEAFKLYAKLDDGRLMGVVRSQSDLTTVYAPWLESSGAYGCCTPDLEDCMGLQGSPCKHLLVLLVGLARAGELPAGRALEWIQSAAKRRPARNPELSAQAFLQYKGAEAGEVDWRPTETIPEDYYTF